MVVRRNRRDSQFNMIASQPSMSQSTGHRSWDDLSFLEKMTQRKEALRIRLSSSVFIKPFLIAWLMAVGTMILKSLQISRPELFFDGLWPEDVLVYTTLSWVLGFLLVFRTSQAYARYWDGGCLPFSKLSIEWFDACAQIVAFAETSGAPEEQKFGFQSTMVTLFSLLHSCALQSISEDQDKKVEVLELRGIDHSRLVFLREQDVSARPEIAAQWVQTSLLDAITKGIVKTPPPIVSRVFQELNSGLVHLTEMATVSENPFPVPYGQVVKALLVFYSCVTPFYAVALTNARGWAGCMTFIAVFIMWTIFCIARNIELPFGDDKDDLDVESQQRHMNARLNMLLDPMARKPIALKEFKTGVTAASARPRLKTQCGRLSALISRHDKDDLIDRFKILESMPLDSVSGSASLGDENIVPWERSNNISALQPDVQSDTFCVESMDLPTTVTGVGSVLGEGARGTHSKGFSVGDRPMSVALPIIPSANHTNVGEEGPKPEPNRRTEATHGALPESSLDESAPPAPLSSPSLPSDPEPAQPKPSQDDRLLQEVMRQDVMTTRRSSGDSQKSRSSDTGKGGTEKIAQDGMQSQLQVEVSTV